MWNAGEVKVRVMSQKHDTHRGGCGLKTAVKQEKGGYVYLLVKEDTSSRGAGPGWRTLIHSFALHFFFRVARPQPHHALVSYALTKEVRHAETCLFAHFPSVTFAGAGQGAAPFVSDSRRDYEKR